MSTDGRQGVTTMRPGVAVPRYKTVQLDALRVLAGAFSDTPRQAVVRLCLQAEQPMTDAHIHFRLPIKDFDVPPIRDAALAIAWVVWQGIIRRKMVYIGCMGGTGRTGVLLALLARVTSSEDGPDAIKYIRRVYRAGAVETKEQEQFVRSFPVKNLRRWYRLCALFRERN